MRLFCSFASGSFTFTLGGIAICAEKYETGTAVDSLHRRMIEMTMKRLLLVLAMILCLMPVLSLAEQPLASKELFPAEGENDKWGYVDQAGSFVIQPVFDHAFGFRGNYAEGVVFPDDYDGDRNPYFSKYSGIIDRNGVFVLEPVYSIDAGYDQDFYGGRDTGIWCITSGQMDADNQLEGWFDIESGYFSGLVWDGVWGWISDDRLIPVTDETFRSGYADRSTGELVIPCQYQCVDPSPFYGGIASVSLEEEEFDETGNRNASCYFLIDETGTEILLPKGLMTAWSWWLTKQMQAPLFRVKACCSVMRTCMETS